MYRVELSAEVMRQAAERFGESRSDEGRGSEYDFVGGPLGAAAFAARDFDSWSYDVIPSVRH